LASKFQTYKENSPPHATKSIYNRLHVSTAREGCQNIFSSGRKDDPEDPLGERFNAGVTGGRRGWKGELNQDFQLWPNSGMTFYIFLFKTGLRNILKVLRSMFFQIPENFFTSLCNNSRTKIYS
jgi:hypothetical protein